MTSYVKVQYIECHLSGSVLVHQFFLFCIIGRLCFRTVLYLELYPSFHFDSSAHCSRETCCDVNLADTLLCTYSGAVSGFIPSLNLQGANFGP